MSDFVGSSISSEVLRQHLAIVSRKFEAGEIPEEACNVYGNSDQFVYRKHDDFIWTMNHLHPAEKTLGSLMADTDRFDKKVQKVYKGDQDAIALTATLVGGAVGLAGVVALAVTGGVSSFAGGDLVVERVCLGATAIALCAGAFLAHITRYLDMPYDSCRTFRRELEGWGAELTRAQTEQDRKNSVTAMLSLDEKRAVLRELESST